MLSASRRRVTSALLSLTLVLGLTVQGNVAAEALVVTALTNTVKQ